MSYNKVSGNSPIQLINIGFGNIVMSHRIIAIVSPESAPIKRLIQEAREDKLLIDATYGRRTRAVIITDSGHIILSSIQPETVANRIISSQSEPGAGGIPANYKEEVFQEGKEGQ